MYFTMQTTMVCQAFAGGTAFTYVPSYSVNEIGSLFEEWHNYTPKEVALCV